ERPGQACAALPEARRAPLPSAACIRRPNHPRPSPRAGQARVARLLPARQGPEPARDLAPTRARRRPRGAPASRQQHARYPPGSPALQMGVASARTFLPLRGRSNPCAGAGRRM
ncbi:MAG: hypothetical protein AVDCRST_MAG26-1045, partial [uncultured Chloroflexia bacterium]